MKKDSSEFIERHLGCGGEVVEIKKNRKNWFFAPSPNGPDRKKVCKRCGQFPKKRDIVSVRPGEMLDRATN